jgi:hypothetical protein
VLSYSDDCYKYDYEDNESDDSGNDDDNNNDVDDDNDDDSDDKMYLDHKGKIKKILNSL